LSEIENSRKGLKKMWVWWFFGGWRI